MADFSKFRTAVSGFNRTDVVNYIESASIEHQKALRKLSDERDRLASENADLQVQLAALTAQLQAAQQEKDKTAAELQAAKQDSESLAAEVQKLVEEGVQLADELKAAQTARDELNSELKAAQTARDELNGELKAAQTARDELNSRLNAAQDEADALRAQLAAQPDEDEADDAAAEPVAEIESEPLETKELAAYRRAEQTERNAAVRARRIYQQLSTLCEDARGRYLDSGEEIAALTADLSTSLGRLQDAFAEVQVIFDDAQNAFDEMQLPETEDEDEITEEAE